MIFDIAVIIFVIVLSLVMMNRGGMRAILSLGGLVVSMIVASMLYPMLTDGIYKTPLPENLEKIVKETVYSSNDKDAEDEMATDDLDALPSFMKNAINNKKDAVIENVTDAVCASVTRIIINVMIFILLIILTKLIIAFISIGLNLTMKLPVLSELNKLVGLGCGLATSVVIVWLAVMFVSSVAASNATVAELIKDSYTVGIMSNISPF